MLEAVEGEPVPVLIVETDGGWSYRILGGTVQCPDSQKPQPWESSHFSITGSTGEALEGQVPFEIECEIEYPDRIRYTYPHSGEMVVGEVWREEPGGDVYQAKRLPSYRVIDAAAASLGLMLPTVDPLPDPMPVGVFRRKH